MKLKYGNAHKELDENYLTNSININKCYSNFT